MPALPSILIVTTLALIVAQSSAVQRLKGTREIGDLAFYLLFAAVGALIDSYQAVVLSPIAEAKGWQHLLLPGIVLGMLGYAVGNYAGLAVAYAARAVIGQ